MEILLRWPAPGCCGTRSTWSLKRFFHSFIHRQHMHTNTERSSYCNASRYFLHAAHATLCNGDLYDRHETEISLSPFAHDMRKRNGFSCKYSTHWTQRWIRSSFFSLRSPSVCEKSQSTENANRVRTYAHLERPVQNSSLTADSPVISSTASSLLASPADSRPVSSMERPRLISL